MNKNIVIFASGSGSNAESIVKHFENHQDVKISMILTNNRQAGVIERAFRLGIPCLVFPTAAMQSGKITEMLKNGHTDLIVLAGYLKLIPADFIRAFEDRIVNIHPALLPNYGGKGMYGMNVHEAVVANKESKSGITIHLVNAEYDKGEHLFQASVDILPTDTAADVQKKVLSLEHEHFPVVIENYLKKL